MSKLVWRKLRKRHNVEDVDQIDIVRQKRSKVLLHPIQRLLGQGNRAFGKDHGHVVPFVKGRRNNAKERSRFAARRSAQDPSEKGLKSAGLSLSSRFVSWRSGSVPNSAVARSCWVRALTFVGRVDLPRWRRLRLGVRPSSARLHEVEGGADGEDEER